jgi:hypothetical protein
MTIFFEKSNDNSIKSVEFRVLNLFMFLVRLNFVSADFFFGFY